MRSSAHRRAVGALFLVLAAALTGVAYAAWVAREWVIVAAAGVIAAWLAALALRAWRPR